MTRSLVCSLLPWKKVPRSAAATRSCHGAVILAMSLCFAGCGSEPPKAAPEAEKKPAEPAIPQEVQDAASTLLGSDAQVLLYGDLAHDDTKQMLAANVVPNTPKSTVAGTVVTRAVIAENENGKWTELFRADEYLKNQKGYLALTPLQAVTGWKLAIRRQPREGHVPLFHSGETGQHRKNVADRGEMESRGQALPIDGSVLRTFPERIPVNRESEVLLAMTAPATTRPGGNATKQPPKVSAGKNLRGLLPYLGRYKGAIAFGLLTLALMGLIGSIVPLTTGIITDTVAGSQRPFERADARRQ